MATKKLPGTGKMIPRKVKSPTKKTDRSSAAQGKPFPIVAIGGSAGGLEAFEAFFKSLPGTVNAAFVVISHLDPKHVSMMSELIGRFTKMQVNEARDNIVVEPENVYVIPPNRELSISQGRLHLTKPGGSVTIRMPIDYFLRSLADDQGDGAIAIIMSGTGTDGALGVRAIRAAGGVVFVQDPADARYNGMPESAIQTGAADYILTITDIASQLAELFGEGRAEVPEDQASPDATEVQKVLSVLRAKTGARFFPL